MKLNRILLKLAKKAMREYLIKEGKLGRYKNKTFKSKKKYSRKNKEWKDGMV